MANLDSPLSQFCPRYAETQSIALAPCWWAWWATKRATSYNKTAFPTVERHFLNACQQKLHLLMLLALQQSWKKEEHSAEPEQYSGK